MITNLYYCYHKLLVVVEYTISCYICHHYCYIYYTTVKINLIKIISYYKSQFVPYISGLLWKLELMITHCIYN